MSIMDLFRPKAAPDPSVANPTVPGDGTKVSDGTGPKAIPKAGEGDESPLAGFAKLWETDPNAKKPATGDPVITADPKKLMEAARNIDFTKNLDQALVAKAVAGDSQAMLDVINAAAQAGFAQSAHTTAGIVKGALEQQAKSFREEVMPALIKQHSTRSGVNEELSTLATNPAAAPMLDMITSGLTAKFPNASPVEIQKKAAEFTTQFGTLAVEAAGFTVSKKVAATDAQNPMARDTNFDWDAWATQDVTKQPGSS